MTGFEAFKTYTALKQHFTPGSTYDFFKYCGKVNVKPTSYDSRTDKMFFEKLARQEDLKHYLVANFADNEKKYIRDLVYNEASKNVYFEWLKKSQSFTYNFKKSLGKLESDFDSNFICVSNTHPPLLKKYLAKDIDLETLCVLLRVSGAMKYWNKVMEHDVLWKKHRQKIERYTPFINVDYQKIKKIIVDFYNNV